MNVGVLELISFTVPPEWQAQRAESLLRRHLHSLMPQVVSCWARRLGHNVHYATYYGQADPLSLLPKTLDLVFVSASTQASLLAYGVAAAFRKAGTRTVLGGPHAKCFPADASRFFDTVVAGACDERLIGAILSDQIGPRSIVASASRPTRFPSVCEREPEILRANGTTRPDRVRVVGLLGSVGCPYTCNFCTEWNSPYQATDAAQLTEDVRRVARHHPRAVIAYHDPNFAVQFDRTLDAIEAAGPPYPRYVMNCSLSVLRPDRLERLRRTNCLFLAPGIESWYDYGNKALVGGMRGRDKLDHVAAKLAEVRQFVRGLQANFIFGTDEDAGREPADLTIEFIRRAPYAWPNVNIPTPYGGTPLYDRYLAENRVQRRLPLAFYCAPYLVSTLKNYDVVNYYGHLIRILEAATSAGAILRRVAARNSSAVRLAHLSQSLSYRTQLGEMRRVHRLLKSDPSFRAFHENSSSVLPEFYDQRLRHRLGRYSELVTAEDCRPVLDPVPVQFVGGVIQPAGRGRPNPALQQTAGHD